MLASFFQFLQVVISAVSVILGVAKAIKSAFESSLAEGVFTLA